VKRLSALKTVMELQFFPILENSRIDSVAMSILDRLRFIDWAKNPKPVIELLEKERRERFVLEPAKVLVDIDSFRNKDDIRFREFVDAMLIASSQLGVAKFKRVAMRQWFAIEIEGLSEQSIFRKLRDRLMRTDVLNSVLGENPDDLALVFELDQRPMWFRRRFEIGAMNKSEWRSRIPYSELVIEKKSEFEQSKWTDGLLEALPSDFLYVDVDTIWLERPPGKKALPQLESIEDFFQKVEEMNLRFARESLDLIRK